jgi:hypothetical protein
MGVDAAGAIYNAALEELFFPFEDVFVTGLVASKLGIRCIGVGEFYNHDPRVETVTASPCFLANVVSFHGISPPERLFTLMRILDGTPDYCYSVRPS